MSNERELTPVEKVLAVIFLVVPLLALTVGLVLWAVLLVWSKVMDLL
jgi:cell division protein FtsL